MKTTAELNKMHDEVLSRLGIRFPEILFPNKNISLKEWSVVACDQYTSDHGYWNEVASLAKGKDSTLHLTLPEIYLEAPDVESRIKTILDNMKKYLASGKLEVQAPGLVYIERNTAASGLRQGILLAMDLECYDYSPDSKTLVRATEGTIVERIPPRLRVRSQADLELPHIMILVDDPGFTLVETLGKTKEQFKSLYSLDLMKHGGKLSAWLVEDEKKLASVLVVLETLLKEAKKNQGTDTPLFFAMGDGNHSLATAKAHWVALKAKLEKDGKSRDEIMAHPARFALAEIVNIHSPGLRFEPIHRAVFTPDIPAFVNFLGKHPLVASAVTVDEKDLQKKLSDLSGQKNAGLWDGKEYRLITFKPEVKLLPPAAVDAIFNDWRQSVSAARIDFIHGWQDTKKLSADGAAGLFVPVIAREKLFGQVQSAGPLPRKAFSMGDAEEKKYYMECRKITV